MVDKELFQRLETGLLATTDLTRMEVELLIKGLEGMTAQQQALELMRRYPEIVRKYGVVASDAARQWYQEARDAYFEGDDGAMTYTATSAQPVKSSWAYEDIQRAASVGIGKLPGMAVSRVMHRVDETMRQNVAHDPAHPRWAVVPSYGACGFCVMIGSNGFYMRNKPVKVQRHDHCRCSVVADWDVDNPHLDGYDPDRLYDAYHEAERSTRAYAEYAWSKMSPSQRKRYEKKGYSAFDRFKTQLVSREIQRRDPSWVQDGKSLPANYSEKPRAAYGVLRDGASDYSRTFFSKRGNEWKDLFIHDTLAEKGFFVYAHETTGNGGTTNIDADVNGKRCEFKSPEAVPNPSSKDELKFVQRNVQAARHQFEDEGFARGSMLMVMSNYYTGFDGSDEMRVFERFCDELRGQGFSEGLFVTKSGDVLRAR